MKLGCFQSNTALREMEYAAFRGGGGRTWLRAADIPLGEANAAETCRQHGLDVHSAGPLFLPDMSEEDLGRRRSPALAARQSIRRRNRAYPPSPRSSAARRAATAMRISPCLPSCSRRWPPIAESKQVRLAFENWPRNGTMLATTPELWDAMFTAVPSPALGLCYDPSHLYWQGIEYIQPIWDFRDRIYHAHAKDTEILTARNRYGTYGRQMAATDQLVALSPARLRRGGLAPLRGHAGPDRLRRRVERRARGPGVERHDRSALRGLQLTGNSWSRCWSNRLWEPL